MTLVHIAGAVRMVTPERCPLCAGNLVGRPVDESNDPALYPRFTHISLAGALSKPVPFAGRQPGDIELKGFLCPHCRGVFK